MNVSQINRQKFRIFTYKFVYKRVTIEILSITLSQDQNCFIESIKSIFASILKL